MTFFCRPIVKQTWSLTFTSTWYGRLKMISKKLLESGKWFLYFWRTICFWFWIIKTFTFQIQILVDSLTFLYRMFYSIKNLRSYILFFLTLLKLKATLLTALESSFYRVVWLVTFILFLCLQLVSVGIRCLILVAER